MLKKYTYTVGEHDQGMEDYFDSGEFYLASDVDTRINDLERAIRVVLSEWKEIEGSKLQLELRQLLARQTSGEQR